MQLVAAGAGVTATLALPAFHREKAAIAAGTGAKQGNKQANNRLEPNQFELQGYNTRIVYSTSSIAGVPQLSYSSREQERTFSGKEIQVEETAFGRSATVFLTTGAADEPIESVTLLLPAIQLSSQVKELPIQTLAVLSSRAAFVNPNAPLQLQTYDTVSLFGVAKQVQF
ncbi:hypothetical protein B7486_44805 [cyanobacterium TDX16]|nr:hypothetical protein B7486_44805 [cyanobacterium TDX16]